MTLRYTSHQAPTNFRSLCVAHSIVYLWEGLVASLWHQVEAQAFLDLVLLRGRDSDHVIFVKLSVVEEVLAALEREITDIQF